MSHYLNGPGLPYFNMETLGIKKDEGEAKYKQWFTDCFRGPYYDKLAKLGIYDIDATYTPPQPYRRNYNESNQTSAS